MTCSRDIPDFSQPHQRPEDAFAHARLAKGSPTFDAVQRPEHYASGGIECIDAIAAAMSVEAFRGYLRGNALKYLWRYERKGGLEDLRKAGWYLDRLQRSIETAA